MAFRFRKSKKVAPGTRINLGRRSAGVSFGNKGGGISFNSRRGVHVRASIPGAGISFTGKINGKRRRKKPAGPGLVSRIITAVLFIALVSWAVPVLIPVFVVGLAAIIIWSVIAAKREQAAQIQGDVNAEPDDSNVVHDVPVLCPGCSGSFTFRIRAGVAPGSSVKFKCPKCKTETDLTV